MNVNPHSPQSIWKDSPFPVSLMIVRFGYGELLKKFLIAILLFELVICQYVLVNKINNTEKHSLSISSAFSFSAGLLKELNDQKGKNGYFSLKNMVANFGGIIVAAIVINQ